MKSKIREVVENQAGVGKDCKPRLTINQALTQILAIIKEGSYDTPSNKD